jgi:hypothetical protein
LTIKSGLVSIIKLAELVLFVSRISTTLSVASAQACEIQV